MAGQTYTARQTAREVAKRLGRPYSDKRVRAWVRDNVSAYQDDAYTAHLYDARLYQRIVSALVAKGRAGRATAASVGRSGTNGTGTTRKPKTTRKPASVAQSAPQDDAS